MKSEPSEAESQFRLLIEEQAVQQGVPRSHALFRHVVDSDSTATYEAGERVRRELSLFGETQGRRVLDVGSGFGGALIALSRAGACAVGVEYQESRVRLCNRRLALHGTRAHVVRGDGFSLPFPDCVFDIVVCSEVLEHVPRKQAFIREMVRTLRPSGVLYLSFPNRRSLENLLSDPHYHLPLVSILPRRIAASWVRRLRGLDYDVDALPAAPEVSRWCREAGVDVASLIHSERAVLDRISKPETIRRPLVREILLAVKRARLSGVLRAGIRFRSGFGSSAVLVGVKTSAVLVGESWGLRP